MLHVYICQFNHKMLLTFLSLNDRLGTIFADRGLFGIQYKTFYGVFLSRDMQREYTALFHPVDVLSFSTLFYL